MKMPEQTEALKAQVSGNHRRVISVRLRALEEACDQLEGLSRPFDRTLTVRSELPPRVSTKLDGLLGGLRTKIAEMKAELDLDRTEIDPAREAGALVASMMVNVEELHPRYWKSYGSVPETLTRYLLARLEDLLRTLQATERVLRRASSPENSKFR
jgi:hypothetical protein